MIVFSGCGQLSDQAGWERRYLSRISGTLADGAILVTPGSIDEVFGTPIVAVDHNAFSSSLPTVDSENLEGAVSATNHLLELGHRHIGFLAGRNDLESARLRERGYREALAAAGIPVDESLVRVGGYNAATAAEPARRLLELPQRPTAIFAANDMTALETMAVAKTLGLRVPDDVSVVGFDNVPESALGEPPLTTVEQPIQEMGREAVRLLLDLIEDRTDEPARVVLPTRLVVRQSTARPA